MKDIITLMFVRNKIGNIFTPSDIIKITNILKDIYKIDINGVDFRDNEINSIYYCTDDGLIVIDYDKFFKRDLSVYSNYRMLFSLAHEIRHASQFLSSLTKSDIISKIYLDCFDYVSMKTIVSKIFYSKNHDAFPIEINADIVAYLLVIYVAYMLNDNIYYSMFRSMLEKRVRSFANSNYDVLKSISGSDILDYINELEEYDLFINGLMRDEKKSLNIASSLVLM